MRRREFLTGTVALAGWRAATPRESPRESPRETPRSALRFGYAAITWQEDDVAAIDDIAALGFRGLQLRASAVKQWGERPAALKELLAARGLTLVALSSGVVTLDPARRDNNLAQHVRHARFVRDAGGLFLQLVDERPPGRALAPDDYTSMGRRLTEIGRRAADLGVTVGYHNHMGNLGQAPDEVARVLDAADPRYVKFELDTAHWQAAGGDPAEGVRRYGDRLLFLHLKDLERPAPGGKADSYRFVELGRGEVDLRGVLAELDRLAFAGWAIVELDRVTEAGRTPRECAAVSKRFLESSGYRV
jgi:inosose dehydratase